MIRPGVASYSLYPLNLMPIELLEWVHRNGGEGVLFSSLTDEQRKGISMSYLHDLGQAARDLGMYIEWGNGQHIPYDAQQWSHTDLLPVNLKAAGEAQAIGTKIIRSCSEGMARANPANPTTGQLIKATVAELKHIIPMLRDNGVTLAIETHFEFTTFDLLKIFEMCETEPGDCLGICLDTMNLLTMLEDPLLASERIMPWVVCTHIKDGGLVFSRQGMTAFPSAIGSGIVDLAGIIKLIISQGRDINLSVESHGGSYLLPIHDPWYINQFPDLTISEYNNLMLLEDRAETLIDSGALAETPEEQWPLICESRTGSDLKKLQEILSGCC
ncbi:MAG: sugar phosphate isomerase/epimerase [Bacteroidales bacterium]|nr:sugar phosphate isomerase/epimerase [Bacteroidales bacterium]